MLIDEMRIEDIRNHCLKSIYDDEDYGFFIDFTEELMNNYYENRKEKTTYKDKVIADDNYPGKDTDLPLFNKIMITLTLSFTAVLIYKMVF